MCDPITLGIAAAGVGAAGSLYSGFTTSQSYKDQARFADRAAVAEGQAGRYEQMRLRTRNDRALADVRQGFISAGVDPNSGSANAVIGDSAAEAALDEQAILYGAKVRADNKRFEAKLARNNSTTAMFGSVLDAASTGLSGYAKSQSYTDQRTMLTNPYAMGG